MKIRVPRWATRGFFVKINGRDQPVKAAPGTLPDAGADLARQRHHRAPDAVPLPPRAGVDQPNVASVFYGPVLLAAEEAGRGPTGVNVTLDARTSASRSPAIRDAAVQHRRRR